MAEIADVRRRLRQTIEQARRVAIARRERAEADAETARQFIHDVATPVARQVVAALRAEGYAFRLSTPPGTVRLVSERRAEDYIALSVDTSVDPVTIGTEVSHLRGRRVSTVERPLRADAALATLTGEDVLSFLLEALPPFVER